MIYCNQREEFFTRTASGPKLIEYPRRGTLFSPLVESARTKKSSANHFVSRTQATRLTRWMRDLFFVAQQQRKNFIWPLVWRVFFCCNLHSSADCSAEFLVVLVLWEDFCDISTIASRDNLLGPRASFIFQFIAPMKLARIDVFALIALCRCFFFVCLIVGGFRSESLLGGHWSAQARIQRLRSFLHKQAKSLDDLCVTIIDNKTPREAF